MVGPNSKECREVTGYKKKSIKGQKMVFFLTCIIFYNKRGGDTTVNKEVTNNITPKKVAKQNKILRINKILVFNVP